VIDGERHLYVFDLVAAIRRRIGLRYIERYAWVKTTTFPGRHPRRFKDQIEYLFHFAPSLQCKIRHAAVRLPQGDLSRTGTASPGTGRGQAV